MVVASLGCAVLFALLAMSHDLIGPTHRTAEYALTLIGVSVYSACLWLVLRVRPATERNAHALLLTLCLAMSLHHGVHSYLLATPSHTTNAILTALACAYFFSSRPWFYAAVAICFLSWLPGAMIGGPFSPDWRHWTATLVSGFALAIAAFEAKRLALIRLETMRSLAEERKEAAEEALARAEIANSDRLAMERAMHESQRRESLGILAGGIAHDFNNLLAIVGGNVELTQMQTGLSPSAKKNLETVSAAVDRAAQLTQQLLVYSGKAQPETTSVDLGQRIHGAARLFQSLLSPDITITLDGPAEGVAVEADGALLDQVVMNCVQNAIEACEAGGGDITIRWGYEKPAEDELRPTEAFIDIADTGCGMDATTQQRMFEPFYTTKKDGTGLGLSAVKGIADSHGATIELSSAPEVGTTIRFTVPLGATEGTLPAARPVSATFNHPVLVVDDQRSVREVATRLLEASGYAVLDAGDGSSALDIANQAEDISAAVVDLSMPDVSGYEVAETLRKRWPGLPIVIMSGFDRDDVRSRSGIDPEPQFVKKPFSRSQLVEALTRASAPDDPRKPTEPQQIMDS